MTDSDIVTLFLRRDETAITKTAEKYGHRLRSLSLKIVGDMQVAEECENDTYLSAWNSIPPHEPREHLFAFLARITQNLSLNKYRDSKRLKRSALICQLTAEMEECIPSTDSTNAHLDSMALTQTINAFLATLDGEKRCIFLRRYWFMDSVSTISRRLGISQSKVKTTLFRTRTKLREFLEKEGYTL